MSGHSKWAQIKRQKGAADIKKGAAFTKLANGITVAVREGGKDPDLNFRLRLAMDKARDANMPKDNVERAIKRGAGEIEGVVFENVTYEGYGPGGAAVVIEVLTDNRNRTAGDMRRIFSEHHGNLGQANSVLWMFERRGRLEIKPGGRRSEIELVAIDSGAVDLTADDEMLTVFTAPTDLQKVRDAMAKAGVEIVSAEIGLVPKVRITPPPKDHDKIQKLLLVLEDHPDITNVSTNADV